VEGREVITRAPGEKTREEMNRKLVFKPAESEGGVFCSQGKKNDKNQRFIGGENGQGFDAQPKLR